jgi:hypothetical protein
VKRIAEIIGSLDLDAEQLVPARGRELPLQSHAPGFVAGREVVQRNWRDHVVPARDSGRESATGVNETAGHVEAPFVLQHLEHVPVDA